MVTVPEHKQMFLETVKKETTIRRNFLRERACGMGRKLERFELEKYTSLSSRAREGKYIYIYIYIYINGILLLLVVVLFKTLYLSFDYLSIIFLKKYI